MRPRILLASAAFLLAAPLSGMAQLMSGPQYTYQARGPDSPPRFEQLDRNGDGAISRDEFAGYTTIVSNRGVLSGPSWDTNPPTPAP